MARRTTPGLRFGLTREELDRRQREASLRQGDTFGRIIGDASRGSATRQIFGQDMQLQPGQYAAIGGNPPVGPQPAALPIVTNVPRPIPGLRVESAQRQQATPIGNQVTPQATPQQAPDYTDTLSADLPRNERMKLIRESGVQGRPRSLERLFTERDARIMEARDEAKRTSAIEAQRKHETDLANIAAEGRRDVATIGAEGRKEVAGMTIAAKQADRIERGRQSMEELGVKNEADLQIARERIQAQKDIAIQNKDYKTALALSEQQHDIDMAAYDAQLKKSQTTFEGKEFGKNTEVTPPTVATPFVAGAAPPGDENANGIPDAEESRFQAALAAEAEFGELENPTPQQRAAYARSQEFKKAYLQKYRKTLEG